MLTSIAAIHVFRLCVQDVTQAYLQFAKKLLHNVYLRSPEELNLTYDELLELLRPLYGWSDSGDFWHHTCKGHLQSYISMPQATEDLPHWFRCVENGLSGMIAVYVDDQLAAGSPQFAEDTKLTERSFQCHPLKHDRLSFPGIQISQQPEGSVLIHQRPHAELLQALHKHCSFSDFHYPRYELAWLDHTLPDVAAVVKMASHTTPTTLNQNTSSY